MFQQTNNRGIEKLLILLMFLLFATLSLAANVDKAYTKACSKNTIVDYKIFLNKYPNSEYWDDVRSRIEELYYAEISAANSDYKKQQLMAAYLSLYPHGLHANIVITTLDSLRYYEVMQAKDEKALEKYLKTASTEKFRISVQATLDSLQMDKRKIKLFEACKNNDIQIATDLLNSGTDPNYTDDKKCCCLHYTVSSGNVELTRLLLQKGAKPDMMDSNETTPLLYATSSGVFELCKVLIDSGAQADFTGPSGQPSALMSACYFGMEDIVGLFLSKSPYLRRQSNSGGSVMAYAISGGYPDIVEMLLKAGADPYYFFESKKNPLYVAATFKDYQTACILLKYGARDTADSLAYKMSQKNSDVGMIKLLTEARNGTFDYVKAMQEPEAKIAPVREAYGVSQMKMYSTYTFKMIEGRKLTVAIDDNGNTKTYRLRAYTKLKKQLPKQQQTDDTMYTDATANEFVAGEIITIVTSMSSENDPLEIRKGAITFGTDIGVQD